MTNENRRPRRRRRLDRFIKSTSTAIGAGIAFLIFPASTLVGAVGGAFVGDYVSEELVDKYYDCRARVKARGQESIREAILKCIGIRPVDPGFERRLEEAKSNAEANTPIPPLPILLIGSLAGSIVLGSLFSFTLSSISQAIQDVVSLWLITIAFGLLIGTLVGVVRHIRYRRKLQIRIDISLLTDYYIDSNNK